jgi:Xaa-Pro aminopeptidase
MTRNNLETIPYWSGKINDFWITYLGLIDKADVQNENPDWPAYKKYFMHGTSHTWD